MYKYIDIHYQTHIARKSAKARLITRNRGSEQKRRRKEGKKERKKGRKEDDRAEGIKSSGNAGELNIQLSHP